MRFKYNDGGRAAEGFKGSAGDCVVRSIAIAARLPYKYVYDRVNAEAKKERLPAAGKGVRMRSSGRTGVQTRRAWFKRMMAELGFTWHPLMKIGTGCTVHLDERELPHGRIICCVSKHYVAVIDGVIHDTYDPSRDGTRCVYGYWQFSSSLANARLTP